VRPEPSGIYRSAVDEARFGIPIARVAWMTAEMLPRALEFAREERVSLLISKCMASERATFQAMERAGFLMMETMLCLEADLTKPIPRDPGTAIVRRVAPADDEAIARVAAAAFAGYVSHYHADDRLDRAKCDEIYVDWAQRACRSRAVADEVLIAESGGAMVGYFICTLNSPEEADVAVAAVVPDRRGSGAYASLVVKSMEWAAEKGADRITGLVQVTNVAVQKTPLRLGWVPRYAYHTFHKWFEGPDRV
jgi:GNAT superfamily N-acetyltransferase